MNMEMIVMIGYLIFAPVIGPLLALYHHVTTHHTTKGGN